MYDRLVPENFPAQLVIVQNANHSFTAPDGTTTPTLGEINQIMLVFLAQYLRAGENLVLRLGKID